MAKLSAPDRKYPIIDLHEFHEGGWKTPFYYLASRAIRGVTKPEDERVTNLENAFYGALDATSKYYDQRARIGFHETFPKIAAYRGFVNDPTNIDSIYTVELEDHELPLYMRDENDPLISDQIAEDGIRHVRDKWKSTYDDKPRAIEQLYDESFDGSAAPKYTRNDINNEKLFPEPTRFRRWLVMDDTWRMQQYGDLLEESSYNVDGVNYTVRHYKKPDKSNSFWFWFWGDKIYDFVDAPFDLVQEKLIEQLPPSFRQFITKEEYKMIARLRRSFYRNWERNPLTYDLTEKFKKRFREEELPQAA